MTFRAPMALSEYRFTARGVTGADTLVGQTTAELTVRKDFFVDLKAPATLTQGDRPRFIGQVHHVGVTGAVDLKLTVYAGGRESVFPRTINVKADGVDEVLFEPFEVPDGENVRLTLTASVGERPGTSWWPRCPCGPGACRRSPRPRGRRATTPRPSSACRRGGRMRTPRCSSSSRPPSAGSWSSWRWAATPIR